MGRSQHCGCHARPRRRRMFGIQTWFGSETIHAMLALAGVVAPAAPWSGAIPPPSRLACFAGFWAMQVAIIVRGMGIIRIVEAIAAPVLLCTVLGALRVGDDQRRWHRRGSPARRDQDGRDKVDGR